MHYLDYLADTGAEFIHPGGERYTSFLLQIYISAGATGNVLEIGCGTGSTLQQFTGVTRARICGVDKSDRMIKSAKRRLQRNRISDRVELFNIKDKAVLPFSDSSFDFIYAESVLAIVGENEFDPLLKEIQRCLKPGGNFVCNDAIWKKTSSAEDKNKLTTGA